MVSATTTRCLGWTHLVNGHRQRIDVALPRGAAALEVKLARIQQLWGHVADDSWFWNRRVAWLDECRVDDDAHHPVVREACNTPFGDQHVPLYGSGVNVRFGSGAPIIAHRVDVTVHDAQKMEIFETAGSLGKLSRAGSQAVRLRSSRRSLTSCRRLAVRFLWRYSRMFPSDSQGLTMQNGNSVSDIPREGWTFGCEMYFQPMISR